MQPTQIAIVHQYMDMITTYLDYIASNVTTDEILPYGCCAYFSVFEDAVKDLHRLCDPITGPETAEWTMNLVRTITYDMIDLGCGKYSSTQACLTHQPQAMRVFTDMSTPRSKIKPQPYTPIVPALAIIKRLDSADS